MFIFHLSTFLVSLALHNSKDLELKINYKILKNILGQSIAGCIDLFWNDRVFVFRVMSN